jgi:uncharacterized coiled-coil DUF342 family protein
MERAKWTDERIDERMAAIDEKLDRQSDELRMLREEMTACFAELRTEMRELRGEMHGGFAELRAEIVGVHRQLVLALTAFGVGVLGLLGAQTF